MLDQALMYLNVGLGGALGAILRYQAGLAWGGVAKDGFFPLSTLLVNLVGTAILAILTAWTLSSPRPWLHAFLATGFCGALTTFSTFSLELVFLWRAEAYTTAALYMAISLLGALAIVALTFYALKV